RGRAVGRRGARAPRGTLGRDDPTARARGRRQAARAHAGRPRLFLVAGPTDVAILRSRSSPALNVQLRTPRAGSSLGPRLARHSARRSTRGQRAGFAGATIPVGRFGRGAKPPSELLRAADDGGEALAELALAEIARL